MSLPARDWISYANRAAVLTDLGDLQEALAANEAGLQLAPGEASLLNNGCYIRTLMGRAQEGLPFCERAVAAAPKIAPVRHSFATALAAVGRCREAEEQIAMARSLDTSSPKYAEPIACASQ